MSILCTVGCLLVSALIFGSADATAQVAPPAPAPFGESMQPSLQHVGTAIQQIQVDRWKVSRESKAQLQNDIASIGQDLSNQLPGLLQAAQASPIALGPQLAVMRNIDALYDVLLRVTTVANLSGRKSDAELLDNALQGLESARKTAADGLVKLAGLQDQEIVQLRSQMQAAHKQEALEAEHPKTIVVNNGPRRRERRHKRVMHPKPSPKANPASTITSPESKTGPS